MLNEQKKNAMFGIEIINKSNCMNYLELNNKT